MKVFSYLEDANSVLESSVIALGNFDGIHKGHQQLISKTVEISRGMGISSVIFTFKNHPLNEIAGKTVVKCIMDAHEKAIVAERLGIDYMANIRFNRFIMMLEPEEFVKRILVRDLKCKHAVCGFNYSFGYKGEGTPEMLVEFGKKYGFDVTVIPEFKIYDQTVSSTFIRGLLEQGDMLSYSKFTGRTYKIAGYVMHGQHVGRTMGFPTANLNLSPDMALPLNGVYITNIWLGDRLYPSVTNIGNKPTVGEFDKNAETHIFDYNEDIYGERVIVEFIEMLRPEMKFGSLEELAKQIDQDCNNARIYHKTKGNYANL